MISRLLILAILLIAETSIAANYYVSPTGSASWSNCTNIATPCSAVTAMSNAVAGDIVYFRGGTYALVQPDDTTFYWVNGVLNPSHSGTSGNPITFMAYPGELPIMDVQAISARASGIAFGTLGNSYIIYDGFKLIADGGNKMGGIKIQKDTSPRIEGVIIRNCIFDGGSSIISSTDNWEGLRIEEASGTLVKDCTFTNYRHTTDYHNTSAIKMYHTDNVVIENNDFYTSTVGVYDKSGSDGTIVRNNFFNNTTEHAIYVPANGYANINGLIYNNLIIGSSYEAISVITDGDLRNNNWSVYNNTLYATSYSHINIGQGNDDEVYNNIMSGTVTGYGHLRLRNALSVDYINNNAYYNSFKNTINFTDYTSLAAWQNVQLDGGIYPDANSFLSNPLFVNGSGNLNTIADFALQAGSPCINAGRDGENIGADVSLVGVDAGEEDTTPPVRSNGSPTGSIEYTATTTISLSTNESATCEYDADEFSYGAGTTFSTTGGVSHSSTVDVSVGGNTFHVMCEDTSENSNSTDFTISFTVLSEEPSPPTGFSVFSGTGNTTIGGTGSMVIGN